MSKKKRKEVKKLREQEKEKVHQLERTVSHSVDGLDRRVLAYPDRPPIWIGAGGRKPAALSKI